MMQDPKKKIYSLERFLGAVDDAVHHEPLATQRHPELTDLSNGGVTVVLWRVLYPIQ